MSQIWDFPILGSDVVSDSRTNINDAFDSVRTNFIGTADPLDLVDGMIWVNTTDSKLRMHAGGTSYDIGDWGVTNLGHIRADGTVAMTGNLDMGTNLISNLAAPTITTHGATKVFVDDFFDTTTGHIHNAITGNAPKVTYANLASKPTVHEFKLLSEISTVASIDSDDAWTTVDISTNTGSDTATHAYLGLRFSRAADLGDDVIRVNLRETDTTPTTPQHLIMSLFPTATDEFDVSVNTFVKLNGSEEFDIEVDYGDVDSKVYASLFGYTVAHT
jgi:hypothetical protein